MTGYLPPEWELGLTGKIEAFAMPAGELTLPEHGEQWARITPRLETDPEEVQFTRWQLLRGAMTLEINRRLPTAYNVGVLTVRRVRECMPQLRSYVDLGLMTRDYQAVVLRNLSPKPRAAKRVLARRQDIEDGVAVVYNLTDEGTAVLEVMDAQRGILPVAKSPIRVSSQKRW